MNHYRFLLSFFFSACLFFCIQAQNAGGETQQTKSNTQYPGDPYCKVVIADTTKTFDISTFTEYVKIVRDTISCMELEDIYNRMQAFNTLKSKISFIEVTDTTAIFDPKTYEEQIKVSFNRIQFEAYWQKRKRWTGN